MVCEVCRTGPGGVSKAGALWALHEQFWLEPVALARNFGFPGPELNKLAELVETNKVTLIEAWNKVHG